MSPIRILVLAFALFLCIRNAFTTNVVPLSSATKSTRSQHLRTIVSTSKPTIGTTIRGSSNSRSYHHSNNHHQRSHAHLYNQVSSSHRTTTTSSSRAPPPPPPPPRHHHYHPDHDVELLPNNSTALKANASASGHKRNVNGDNQQTTRLRRIHSNDYNRNGRSRPMNSVPNEWAYHTYNVQSNTFGPPPPPFPSNNIGKGDDNTHDVEFIGSSNTNFKPDHPRRSGGSYPSVTTLAPPPPPPLVPARRGYTTETPSNLNGHELSPVTDDPFETNTISKIPNSNSNPKQYPSDPKDMESRHICVQQRTITMPVKTTEVYMRPTWKHVKTPCQPPTYPNQMCTRVQLVHEQAYRDVIRHKSAQHVTFDCCSGWMREKPHADACLKPVCMTHCQNGGSCTGPDTCTCPAGFTGRHCEHDINECKEEKPCDQTCINTVGSFYCKCRQGFVLQSDRQSCKKIDLKDDDAFEARDLENEIDTDDNDEGNDNDGGVRVRNNEVTARLHKIERSLANERIQTHELQKSLQATYHVVDTLKSRLNTLEKQQQDLNRLQTNLYDTESRTNKLESMVNLLMKCRNGPNANCP